MSTRTRRPTVELRRLRTLSVLLAFTAAVGLVFGTAGFTMMSADRGIDASVVADDEASLGYDTLTDEVDDGESTAVVAYHNQFEHDLDEFHVDVSIVDPDTETTLVDAETPDELPSATDGTVDVTLACPVEEEVHLQFEATGSGGGVSVSLDRVHTVTCLPDDPDDPDDPTVTGVQYNDAANADVHTDGSDGNVSAIVWIVDSPPVDTPDAIEPVVFDDAEPLDTAKKVRPEVVQSRAPSELPNDWKIVAIEFPDQDVAYVHPQWDAGEYDAPKTGDGVETTELPLDAEQLVNTSVVDESEDG